MGLSEALLPSWSRGLGTVGFRWSHICGESLPLLGLSEVAKNDSR